MGVLVETLNSTCEKTVDEVARLIDGEMKGVVGGHTRSGKALGAIHIERMGPIRAFVGGTGGEGTLHLYFLDQGNGGNTIYPKNKRMLKFSDGSLHPKASPYAGINFVHEIASHYGG